MPPHILIVEDEPSIADTLLFACKDAGLQTTHCLLGSDALAASKTQSVDLIVLDIGLPDMTGFDVCKQIRTFSQVPVLFLTARNHEIDRIVGLEIGADDYVTKPFSPREVVARIKAILRRTEMKSSTENQANAAPQFKLDDSASRIQYCGVWLHLTRYEFGLLKTLLAQPNRVYNRAQLMDLVWTDAEDSFERTVDAHVKTLRAKLKQINPQEDAIITHRGLGYSLLA